MTLTLFSRSRRHFETNFDRKKFKALDGVGVGGGGGGGGGDQISAAY